MAIVRGTKLADLLTGTADSDKLLGLAGDDTLAGGDGNDILTGAGGNDTITGGAGADKINGGGGNDEISGGDDNDDIIGGGGDDVIQAGSSNDKVKAGGGNDIVRGGDDIDKLYGENGNDTIYGDDGDDLMYGDAGNDTMDGGLGADYMNGGIGDDTVSGGAGADRLYGLNGNDTINGDDGNDIINGGIDNDTIRGGNDDDLIVGEVGHDTLYGDAGNDALYAGFGNDTVYGGDGDDYAFADADNDFVYGEAGNDTLLGGDGNDTVSGGDGDDSLDGGEGTDFLIGGAGNDVLSGWLGQDTAVFSGNLADYDLVFVGTDIFVTHTRGTATDGTDTVRGNVEWFQFADGTYARPSAGADSYDVSTPTDSNSTANFVNENSVIGSAVGITAHATDADLTNNLVTYSLTDNAGGLFQINASTGVVTTLAAINAETAGTSKTITVQAASSDGSISTQTFTITIGDVDEFDVGTVTDNNSATNTVAENAAVGTTVGVTARATDADASNNDITYTLTNDAGGLFQIDSVTGVVTVLGSIDRETLGASTSITVKATSSDGSFSSQTFTIAISDVNEFTPDVPDDSNAAANAVNENAAAGTAVGITASSVDDDATNNTITYSLTDSAGGLFQINATTGVVTVLGAIDRETVGATANITVKATSSDGTFATQTFAITINNVNEAASVTGASANATQISFTATDGDAGDSLSIATPFATIFAGAVNNGTVTTRTVAEQTTLTSGTLSVRDTAGLTASVMGLVLGTSAGETITAPVAGGANALYGFGGNDTMTGSTVADVLVGGAGSDAMTGGTGIDTFYVDSGTDTISDLGQGGADILVVSAGASVTATANAAWTATSSTVNAGTATINTAGKNIDVSAATGTTGWTITGSGSTAMTLTGGANADTITGGTGADTINGGIGNDALTGGSGIDTFTIGSGTDTISDLGNGGADIVTISAGATLNATATAAWTATASTVNNGTAATIATAGFGVNVAAATGTTGWTITGSGATAMTLTGGTNNDTITGGSGADTINGGAGADTLTGGAGIDTFTIGSGTDTLTDLGNGGADVLVISAGATLNATATAAWTATSATANSGTAATIATAGFGINVASATGTTGWTITGSGATAMVLTGGANADVIKGGSGADTINGGAGADTIWGGDGADTINTGAADDNLVDVIRYAASTEYGDTVTNFDTTGTVDVVRFTDALRTDFDDVSVNGVFTWATGNSAAGTGTSAILTSVEGLYLSGVSGEGVTNALLNSASSVAAAFNTEFAISGSGDAVLVINDTDLNGFSVWHYVEAGTSEIQAAELTLVGVFSGNGTVTTTSFTFG
ncbi:MAG: cadherin domain-containing protein [Hyphomicrobiaceae bacterium]